jgi:hypothetical protein
VKSVTFRVHFAHSDVASLDVTANDPESAKTTGNRHARQHGTVVKKVKLLKERTNGQEG